MLLLLGKGSLLCSYLDGLLITPTHPIAMAALASRVSFTRLLVTLPRRCALCMVREELVPAMSALTRVSLPPAEMVMSTTTECGRAGASTDYLSLLLLDVL